jgi:hypothetical protein
MNIIRVLRPIVICSLEVRNFTYQLWPKDVKGKAQDRELDKNKGLGPPHKTNLEKKKVPKKNDPPKTFPTMISRRFLVAKFRQNAKTKRRIFFPNISLFFPKKLPNFGGKTI